MGHSRELVQTAVPQQKNVLKKLLDLRCLSRSFCYLNPKYCSR